MDDGGLKLPLQMHTVRAGHPCASFVSAGTAACAAVAPKAIDISVAVVIAGIVT
jgi:hypothetical protein